MVEVSVHNTQNKVTKFGTTCNNGSGILIENLNEEKVSLDFVFANNSEKNKYDRLIKKFTKQKTKNQQWASIHRKKTSSNKLEKQSEVK